MGDENPIVSYSPYCMHCLGVTRNEIDETIAFCEEWDLWRNVTLGGMFRKLRNAGGCRRD